jgi:hypothetical protein
MKKICLLGAALSALLLADLPAQIASDVASNYVSWGNGSNGGTGFLAWNITSNNNDVTIFAGTFLGDSTAGAGNINTAGQSFGLYANPSGAFVNADRAFASSLAVGNVFSFEIALNFDNGNKGFNLFAGNQGEVFNFNVGNGGSVSSLGATLNPGSGAGYDYGGNDAVLNVTITMTTVSSFAYEIARNSSSGNQGTLFSGTVTGLTDNVTGFRLYNSNTDNGTAQNNLYANNFTVVPEPATWVLLGLGSMAWVLRRKMKKLS